MSSYKYTVLDKIVFHKYIEKFWYISLFILLVTFSFLFLPWEQTVKGEGVISASNPTQRPYAVSATIDGFIDKFHVQENKFVKKGDLLFTMVDLDRTYSTRLKDIHAKYEDQLENTYKQIILAKGKKKNLEEYLTIGLNVFVQKLAQTRDKIKSLQLKKVTLDKNHQIEKLNFERINILYKDGIESKRKYDNAENIYIKANAQLQKIIIDMEVEKKNISILNKEKEKFYKDTHNKIKSIEDSVLAFHNKVTSIEQDLQRQSMNISRYDSSEVYAQKNGQVLRLYETDNHKLLKKGEEVIYFAPEVDEKILLLRVSDFNMPLMKKGLPVRLMFYGWPAMQISGWPKITHGTFAGIIQKLDSVSHEKGYFYAYVVEDPNEPWPKGDVLKVGTQTSAWIRLETVPIWYQIWRTINGLPPRMIIPKAREE